MPPEIKNPYTINPSSYRPYHLIHEIYVLSDACDRQVLDQFSMNNSQYRVFALLHQDQGQRMTTLGEKLMLSKSTITRIVDQLEERDWVKRMNDPNDRRAQYVVLTANGDFQRKEITAAHLQSLVERMDCLNHTEQTQLELLLDKLSSGLRSKIETENSNGAAADTSAGSTA
ncbi:MAG: MarR family transcriptional regulator [Anaerolineales bacterium]|nr:MarR family transcriptional regulator [Anaerolineales bacterium]